MSEIKYVNGRPMVPSGHADGHYVPVALPGSSERAAAQLERDRAMWQAEEERRRQRYRDEDAAHDREQAAKREAHEAELRRVATAEAARVRADVERQLRLGGVPEPQIRALADQAMTAYHLEKARETAASGGQSEQELREFFRRQASAAGRIGG